MVRQTRVAQRAVLRAVKMVKLSWSAPGLSWQQSERARRRWRVARRARSRPPRLLLPPKPPVQLLLRLSSLRQRRRVLRRQRLLSQLSEAVVAHRGLHLRRLPPQCRRRARLQRRMVTWRCCASLWPRRALALSRRNQRWPTSAAAPHLLARMPLPRQLRALPLHPLHLCRQNATRR
jgi:hypothetical protein